MTQRTLPLGRRAFIRDRAPFSGTGIFKSSAGSFRLLRSRVEVRYVAVVLVIGAAYFAGAKWGFSFAFATEQVTAIWPPTGIAITALLLFGLRVWPGVFLGALFANATNAESVLTATGIAVGNTLAGVVGAFLLRDILRFHVTLERARDVLGLVCAALLSTVVSATLGTLNLATAGLVEWHAFASVWTVWWMGDTLGILLVAPCILSWWMRPTVQWRDWRLAEYGALTISILTVSLLTFARPHTPEQPSQLLAYSAYPLLVWAALRFQQREVVSAVLIIAAIAVWGTAHELGPFTHGTLDNRLIALDTFAAVTVVTALLLGAVTAERRRSHARLNRARAQLERRVKIRTAELERANRELFELSYSMSHDLRAPLRAVNSFSKLLTEQYAKTLDGEGTRFLGIIERNSRHMGRMVDDYLRLFRLREEPLIIKSLDVNTMVWDVIEQVFPAQVGINVRFDVRPLPPVAADDGLIRQIWMNLLDNAVKFSSHAAAPAIEIGGSENGDEVTYYVKDNGVGFDMQWRGQLFKVFQRLHPREFDGIGMGLAIVARIVQRHGGTIQATGEVGRGATFSFTLPLRS